MKVYSHVYWIASGDRAYGQDAAERVELLRALWRAHRVVAAVGPFDGASFWIADGRAVWRIIRTADATAGRPVEVVDVVVPAEGCEGKSKGGNDGTTQARIRAGGPW